MIRIGEKTSRLSFRIIVRIWEERVVTEEKEDNWINKLIKKLKSS